MKEQIQLSTRQLLREFKTYKEMLLSKKTKQIRVPVDVDHSLMITLEKRNGNSKQIADMFSSLPAPIKLKRHDDIFEELIR